MIQKLLRCAASGKMSAVNVSKLLTCTASRKNESSQCLNNYYAVQYKKTSAINVSRIIKI